MVNDMEDIVIIGFGGHAKSVADSMIQTKKYNIVGYTDKENRHNGFVYLGTDECLPRIYSNGIHKAILGIGFLGNSRIRDKLVVILKKIGFEFPSIVDISATLARNVNLGEGCYVGKNAVINADSQIGSFCIINSGAIIEHENIIEDYSHVAVGSILCREVRVGNHTFIGAGSTVIQGIKIGENCIIGANSTVLTDIGDKMKVYGIININRRK